jgi:hypothetical protein
VLTALHHVLILFQASQVTSERKMSGSSTPQELVPVSFTSEQLVEIKSDITDGAPYAVRMSLALAIRLAMHPNDKLAVLHEIDGLEHERPGTTVRPTQFKYPPLFPLWHKHYFMPRHVQRNFGDRWGVSRGEGNRDLRALLSGIATQHGNDPEKWQGTLVHQFVMGGLLDRANANRLTGDWIIFGKHAGKNYYLDLATHEEGEGENAERLMQKLRAGCQAEFPFLF